MSFSNQSRIVVIAVLSALAIFWPSCADDGSDSSADDDASTDTDTDTDTDTTENGDECGDCPLNSGYPCPCDVSGGECEDGSMCGNLPEPDENTSGNGYCAAACESFGQADACPDSLIEGMDCAAEPICELGYQTGDEWNYICALVCTADEECPSEMYCDSTSGHSVCYPY
jgi:hypothetical protein